MPQRLCPALCEERGQGLPQFRLVKGLDDRGRLFPAGGRGSLLLALPNGRGHCGEYLASKACLIEEGERPAAAGPRHHRPQLGGDPLGAHARHEMPHRLDRCPRGGVEGEAEGGGKPHGPQHPQMVFAESHRGHADRPHDAGGEIGLATNIVVHLAGPRIEEEAVDREVSPLGVEFGGGEYDAGRVAAVGVGLVGAKRGHLHLPRGPRPEHRDHPEGGPHGERTAAAEDIADLLGAGRCGHVVVGGGAAEQVVADAATGPKSSKTRVFQAKNHLGSEVAGAGWIGL